MRRPEIPLAFAWALAGCTDIAHFPDSSADGPRDAAADLLPACAAPAAAGLTGTPLVCVDFTTMPDGPPTIAGWNFAVINPPICPGWTVLGGKLQLKGFQTWVSGSCLFTLPSFSATDFGSYTISLVHRLDISDAAGQKVQLMLGADNPLTQLVTQWSGKEARQQSSFSLARGELPNGGTSVYQPWLKFSSTTTAGGGYQGWLIESIVVMGSP